MKEDKLIEDINFTKLIKELKTIKRANNSKRMLYDFERIYNDAINHLVAFHKIDGECAMEIVDRLLKEND